MARQTGSKVCPICRKVIAGGDWEDHTGRCGNVEIADDSQNESGVCGIEREGQEAGRPVQQAAGAEATGPDRVLEASEGQKELTDEDTVHESGLAQDGRQDCARQEEPDGGDPEIAVDGSGNAVAWSDPPVGIGVQAPPKLRYEMRTNGPAYQLPVEVIEAEDEEDALEQARQRILRMRTTKDNSGRLYVYPLDIKQVVLKPI